MPSTVFGAGRWGRISGEFALSERCAAHAVSRCNIASRFNNPWLCSVVLALLVACGGGAETLYAPPPGPSEPESPAQPDPPPAAAAAPATGAKPGTAEPDAVTPPVAPPIDVSV